MEGKLNFEFTFYNIGQGLFYTGRISKFVLIYDCGSKSGRNYIREAIKKFQSTLSPNKKVELLILSHLDWDHVNGLEELLSNVSVETVVLPYFLPEERLLVALSSNSNRLNRIKDWYLAFLSDPIEFLFEKGVARLVLIRGQRGGEFSEGLPERNEGINWDKMEDDSELKEKIREKEPELFRFVRAKKLLLKTHNQNVYLKNYWFFRFFNQPIDLKTYKNFIDCLKNKNLYDSQKIKKAIKNSKKIKDLKNCYLKFRKELKSINNTSLCLLHGPMNFRCAARIYYLPVKDLLKIKILYGPKLRCYIFDDIFYSFSLQNPYQLLLGDLNLNYKIENLLNHMRFFLQKINIVQLPHHGSFRSWNDIIIKNIDGTVWVASAGYSNKYGHPSFKVVNKLLKEKKLVFVADEFKKVIIEGSC